MPLRASPVLLAALTVTAPGCGGDSPSDPGAEPAPAVASVHIVAGDGQTDSAGSALPVPVVIEVLDVNGHGSPGRTVVLTQAGAEPNLNYQSDDPSGDVVTDSAGRAEVIWRVYGTAGTRHLIASVRGWAVVGKDTITATVLPAGPYQVEYAEPEVYRLLGEPADLGANIRSVADSWGNPVAVQTVVVEAPAPLELSGQTTILSHQETDTTVTLRINGVAFPQRVVVLRSIQEFLGAVGDWTCAADPASSSHLRSQAGHFVVDSITRYGDYGAAWTLHLSTTLKQTFDNAPVRTEGPLYERRYVLYQFPHGFLFPYGPEMDQIGTDPIRYRETQPTQCSGWDGSGPHVPLTMTLVGQ